MTHQLPTLERLVLGDLVVWTDPAARAGGVLVAFTERTGGVSQEPYASLNLAAHVGDVPAAVDKNRLLALDALRLADCADRLVVAEQVHGVAVTVVDESHAGRGAFASAGHPPIPRTDAMLTARPRLPLIMCFADCVPILLVAPGPVVGVVHAGWRGALGRLPQRAVTELSRVAGCPPRQILAYVGAHIGSCHYEVDSSTMSQFVESFGTVAQAGSGGLDLGSVVTADLTQAGVDSCNIARLGTCTAEATERFFSYRAEGGVTGRHGAVCCILSQSSS